MQKIFNGDTFTSVEWPSDVKDININACLFSSRNSENISKNKFQQRRVSRPHRARPQIQILMKIF